MQKIFITTIIILFAVACNTPETPKEIPAQNILQDSATVVNDPKSYLNIQATNFSEIDTSGILMFPLTMGETTRGYSNTEYKSMPSNAYWNIVFHNIKTDEQYLLSDKKMLIRNFNTDFKEGVKSKLDNKYIFYTMTTEDFNGDKKFTEEDASYLFLTDKAGNNLKQISPSNYNLQNWEYIASSNKIIMTLKKDSDKNKLFEDKDEVTNFM